MAPSITGVPTHDCAPFLRWAGSKRRLLPTLQEFWTPKHTRYIEPFVGSACLFFAIKPPKAVLGDLNPELIATYIEIKYRISAVLKELKKLKPTNKHEYKRLRSIDIATMTPSARAARFIYLNRFCFNGIYRTNLQGQFNVPYSGDRCGNLPKDEAFKRCSTRLRQARLVNGDFESVLKHAVKGDLIYMDPPYAVRARRIFREYDPSTFTHKDIARLRSWMEKLDTARIDFVVSYAESDVSEHSAQGFFVRDGLGPTPYCRFCRAPRVDQRSLDLEYLTMPSASPRTPEVPAIVPSGRLQYLLPTEIKASTHNPRRLFDPAQLLELKTNIGEHGVLVPLTVFQTKGQKHSRSSMANAVIGAFLSWPKKGISGRTGSPFGSLPTS